MNKSEKLHLRKVAALGCIACRVIGFEETPAEIHHPRTGQGKGRRAPHSMAIPLCHIHHRTGGYGVAIHAGQKAFEEKFGTELELLAEVKSLLGLAA